LTKIWVYQNFNKKELLEYCPHPISKYSRMKKISIVNYLVNDAGLNRDDFYYQRWLE
tara:strand:- start:1062 stop:1232 length:171 start_codon:yes stop_codon:yes gene_type:complete